MSDDITIEIGTSAEEMGRRLVEAWEAVERGEVRAFRRHMIFETITSLFQGVQAPANDQPSGLDEAELMAARRAAVDL